MAIIPTRFLWRGLSTVYLQYQSCTRVLLSLTMSDCVLTCQSNFRNSEIDSSEYRVILLIIKMSMTSSIFLCLTTNDTSSFRTSPPPSPPASSSIDLLLFWILAQLHRRIGGTLIVGLPCVYIFLNIPSCPLFSIHYHVCEIDLLPARTRCCSY